MSDDDPRWRAARAYLDRLPATEPAAIGEVQRLDGTLEVRVESGGVIARWWREPEPGYRAQP